jgi:hypothetical protein
VLRVAAEADPEAGAAPPILMAFDLLYRDGRDVTMRPLRDRRARLEDVVAGNTLVFRLRRPALDGLKVWAHGRSDEWASTWAALRLQPRLCLVRTLDVDECGDAPPKCTHTSGDQLVADRTSLVALGFGRAQGPSSLRSNSQAAKHRTWTWNLSRSGLSPSRANSSSNSA